MTSRECVFADVLLLAPSACMEVWQQQTQREERLKDLHKDGGRIGVIAEGGGRSQIRR
jgi:hypothetical protein